MGGPLQAHVYGGRDGSFALVEDDGESTAYASGGVRTTRLSWDDKAQTLSWRVTGGAIASPQMFSQLYVTLFDSGETRSSAPVAIGGQGSIDMKKHARVVEA